MNARTALVVVARDKSPYVAETVRACFAQETADPLDIFLSDQGSTDGTREIMAREAQRYNGPHRVRVIDCPDTGPRGMHGLNAHYNWLHEAIPADFVAYTAADDLPEPKRMARTLEVLDEHAPDYIGTCQANYTAIGEYRGHTANPESSGPCDLVDIVERNLGGSMSSAWSKACFAKHGPLFTSACQDLIVPFWAGLGAGMYYIAEPLQLRIHREDRNNTGLEGLRDTRQSELAVTQVMELLHYQFVANWAHMLNKVSEHYGEDTANPDANRLVNFLIGRLLGNATEWANSRDVLTRAQVQPACFATRKGLLK